ncbi:uncharacterized protein Bfra_004518 [Botrytis fragariae]|uniref:Uncharacterized protein n=1 Tax=Botrytis fragariae TaxID=1964551 RepID=A0A8H6AVF0_9HELO|nr:uncharacterized protein Bfra_004518 [Botrytis fragariae]KAF5874508.1 hypothetical protein Bfra_004518 [Botrytis fragariae]
MVQLIVTGPSPERLKRARTLQRKLLKLISAARRALFELIPTPRESSLSFKWRFTSPEYDGFSSEPDEVNEFHLLPQKMTIKWSLEDIRKCGKAFDGGFISITASSQSHTWDRHDIHKYKKFRFLDFIESSLGRSLKARPHWFSPVSNDKRFNFYRWQFSETFPGFWQRSFSLWLSVNYFELNNALDTGALTVVPIREYEASQNRLSTRVCRPKAQVSIGQMSLSAIVPFQENAMQIPASEKAQCKEAPPSIIAGKSQDQNTTHNCKDNCARATLNVGSTFAIQLKIQMERAKTLENENDRLNVQVLQLEYDQAMLQQEISNTRKKDEKEIAAARLEGEKIAEENVLRLWNSAKERGRVIGRTINSFSYTNSGIGEKRGSPNFVRRMPPVRANESRDHLSKTGALHSPPPSNLASPADRATASPEDLLPTIATFRLQNSRRRTVITNASVQIPPATNAFHESFLNRIFGSINRTLNIVPPSHIPNPVQWTKFFNINLDTQPYIFPLSNPMQTYGQIVHFVSQATAESPRVTQGTIYPTFLRLSQDTDEYYYIGHFVVSSVVTTTDFNQVLENLPDFSPNEKGTRQKLLKERNRALGSTSVLENDLPVNFYTLQHVFFGEEQYKILIDAKNKCDAMKAADHTIDLLIEADNRTNKSPTSYGTMDKTSQTDYLSELHNQNFTPPGLKVPIAPKAMRSDHSTIEEPTILGSIHRSSIHSSRVHNIPTEPAAMRGGHLSSESETFLESSYHNFIRSSLSQTINVPKRPAAMVRVYPPASDKEVPSHSKPIRSSTIGTNSSLVNGTSSGPVVEGRSYTTGDKEFPKNSYHHDIVSTPLTHFNNSQGATATLNERQTPGGEFESLANPNCHQTTNSLFSPPRKNREETIQRKRKHTSGDESRNLREHSRCFGKTISPGSVQFKRTRHL